MCLEFILKYLLFFFNLVIWLVGVALIVVGVGVLVNVQEILDLIPVDLSGIPIAVIVVGCIIFVIAFSGCYGAITESRCWLILYAVFMVIMVIASGVLAYFIFTNLSDLPSTVQGWVNEAFHDNVNNNNFQAFEVTFQCCGSTGADSYTSMDLPIPPTCCPAPENYVCTGQFYKGCAARLGEYLDTFGEAIGIVIIVVIVIEVIAMLSAFYMNHKITRRNQRGKMY